MSPTASTESTELHGITGGLSPPRGPAEGPRLFARRVGWSMGGSLATLFTSVIATLAISRFVDPSEYGRVSVTMSAWGLLVAPITWCGWLVIRFGPIELEESGRIARVLATRAVFAAPGIAIALIAAVFTGGAAHWSPELFGLTLAWLVGVTASDLAQATAVAAQRFRVTAIANVLTKGLPILVVVGPLISPYKVRAEHMLGATVAATTLGAGLLLASLRDIAGNAAPDKALLRRMWRAAAPALVGLPATAAIAWIDPLVLSRFVSRAEVGHYQLAYPVMTISAAVGASLNVVFSPALVRAEARGDRLSTRKFVSLQHPRLAITLGFAAFSVACVAEPIVAAVIGSPFAYSARLASILLVAAGFQMAANTLYAVVTSSDAQARAQAANIVQAVVNVGGDIYLGSRFGAAGVAMANVLAWAVSGTVLAVALRGRGVRAWPWCWLFAAAPVALAVVTLTPSRPVAAACALVLAVPSVWSAVLLVRRHRPGVEAKLT